MIKLRAASTRDIAAILNIYAPYVKDTVISFEYDVPTKKEMTERFLHTATEYPYLVCEIDGKIAGFAYASPAFGRIAYQWSCDASVYIDEDYHRRGIGHSLYCAMTELLTVQGYRNLYAVITANNNSSILFHEKEGFSSVGVYHKSGYKFGAWHDVLWMEKHIGTFTENPAPPIPFPALSKQKVETILEKYVCHIK
jgi:L-amino acid N-acyltransferase YncA